jgi:probable rRNA maturation factor
MNANVYITNEGSYPIDENSVRAAVEQAVGIASQQQSVALSVTITSSERVHELNLQYAGMDYPTDVLSFPAEEEPYAVEPGDPPYIGDIVIAYPIAEKQAAEAGQTIAVELQLLAIHGTLHLLGFDHDTPDRQAEMWAYQSAALDAARAATQ